MVENIVAYIYSITGLIFFIAWQLNYRLTNDKTTTLLPTTVSNYVINRKGGNKKNQINERVPLMRAKNREERGRGCSPLTVEHRVALVGPVGAAVFHLNGATS